MVLHLKFGLQFLIEKLFIDRKKMAHNIVKLQTLHAKAQNLKNKINKYSH